MKIFIKKIKEILLYCCYSCNSIICGIEAAKIVQTYIPPQTANYLGFLELGKKSYDVNNGIIKARSIQKSLPLIFERSDDIDEADWVSYRSNKFFIDVRYVCPEEEEIPYLLIIKRLRNGQFYITEYDECWEIIPDFAGMPWINLRIKPLQVE